MTKKEATSSVRDEFSKLSLDGKTSFLVEAVFSTAGSAINEIGERVSSLVDLVTGAVSGDKPDEASEPPAASESKKPDARKKKASDDTSK